MAFIFHPSSFILVPPSSDDLNRLLKAWRFWVLASLLGGLIGAVIYFVAPPPYRAMSVVQIDFNIEEAYKPTQDKQAFYYVEREVRKLEALAYSDAVLNAVAGKVGGVTVSELREEKLLLSQPGDADWHFFAEDRDPKRAVELAGAWAEGFTAQVKDAATVSMTLQSYHATIEAGCGSDCDGLEARIAGLEARAQGISPYLEVSLLQSENLTVTRKLNLSAYILVGAIAAMTIGALVVLFLSPQKANEQIGK